MPASLQPAIAPTAKLIRPATRADVQTIVTLIRELAIYEKLEHEAKATEESIARNLFGPHPYAECLIAELNGEAVGFALFFHNFSTFLGKPGIYLEDLFVRPACRGSGIGKDILRTLAELAQQRDCGRIEWSVLDWNESAIQFYRKIGAKPQDEWTVYRMTSEAINKLAGN